ncbi:uracil-DNA glycosylase [Thermococcus argininiproducens]|uniref:Uracil-DNA glycosylase n=1 Tax=Thermococcus argininiproducens TaxID=2866384 RepID=A0A9E7M9P3_9EURY|nr:uracil-DNA glycosylase family protein [Thermococcus argininiproducens]USG99924.1 uracil-DNA glycosylase [Thermococcus argininiproducens]
MLLRFEGLRKIGEIYINPKNFKVMPLVLRDWRDLLALDEKTYGLYSRTIYNPNERFLVKTLEDEKKVLQLVNLYNEFINNPLKFCHDEYYQYQVSIKGFDGLPFANGWVGSKVVLVGEAPGRKGCGLTGICFYRDASGMLLRKVLFSLGVNPDFVYITNVVKCNPPENKFKGFSKKELSLLEKELKIVKPKGIFAIGRTAYKALKKLGVKSTYLKHPAWYVRRGIRDVTDQMSVEYETIRRFLEDL